jgi:hypothetical protein
MKLTTKKLVQIIREEVENALEESTFRVGGPRDPMKMGQGSPRGRHREDDEYSHVGDTAEKEKIRYLKRYVQQAIGPFVWGEEGIIAKIHEWMNDRWNYELPTGFESPTQIANTEFGKAIMKIGTLQKVIWSIAKGEFASGYDALSDAIRDIPGIQEVDGYEELAELGEDPAEYIAYDIMRYLRMKLVP